jgi:hypothetical protein
LPDSPAAPKPLAQRRFSLPADQLRERDRQELLFVLAPVARRVVLELAVDRIPRSVDAERRHRPRVAVAVRVIDALRLLCCNDRRRVSV